MFLALHSVNHFYRGQFHHAVAQVRQSFAVHGNRVAPPNQPWINGLLARYLIEVGELEQARACIAALEQLASHPDTGPSERGVAYTSIIDCSARLGDRERAGSYYDRLRLLGVRTAQAISPLDRSLGLAADCRGEPLTALRHLADSVAREREHGLLPRLVISLLHQGAIMQRLGGRYAAEGQTSISEALKLAADLGMSDLAGRVLAAATAPAPAAPCGLSERQLDVLRLLARGLTNREIANALSISAGTVANHLTAVFTRIGVDNRAAAVAFAHRHGLSEP
jgi:ATP/maltotriose-dependent transcriptional regulator MalT